MSFGRLEKPVRNRPMSEINVTPLVDVMLVLLVIFIITAPLMTSKLALELPKAQAPVAEKTQAPDAFVSLNIDAKGQVYWDDEAVDTATVRERLAQAAKVDTATELRLRADTAVPYGQVVQLIGMAQAVGLSRIGFVADPITGAPLPEAARKP
jgi:biopolymer transport protein TolR